MGDLRVRMLIEAEAQGAQAALRDTETRLAAVGARARETTRDADRTIAAIGRVGQSSGIAAGQVANLAAQFNDIGQMIAAGQSPLVLAVQQGTQIAQVLGPMGAAGAVRALGAALAAVLSPVNLLTIGAVAAGAAMAQWLTRAGDDAATLDTALDGVTARALVGALDAAADAARGVATSAQARLSEARLRLAYAQDPVGLAGALERDRAERAIPRYGGEDAILRIATERQRQQAIDAAVAAAEEAARLDEQRRRLLAGAGGGRGSNGGAGLAGRAADAMRELDIAVGAVNEKVRAGLLSTAEGAEAIAAAKRRAADALADLIPRLEAMGPAGRASAEAARTALAGLAAEAGRAGEAVRRSLVASFEESFARSLATGRDAMSAFADHVQMELARAFTRKFVTPLITPLIDSILGAFAFAQGGVPAGPPAWAARAAAPAGAATPAAQVAVRPVRVEVHNHAGRGDETVEATRFATTKEDVIRLVIRRVTQEIAADIGLGRGPVTAALTGVLGARRRGR